ncbi:MAG: HPr kinase/phosphatase C-terminal domain-containing protein [Rhodobacteraceae bacterium]|nr:HPr kinase/phosphatase C-terminal domain-containing protein [Paracoccaceae bacterium]
MSAAPEAAVNLHATAVALDAARGVLILGRSGAGKSALGLELMALGAQLVSDDRVDVARRDGALWASAPAAIRGRIEARGIGLLEAPPLDTARLVLVVDLDRPEPDRLPPHRVTEILGISLPLVFSAQGCSPAAILQYLKGRRVA